MDETIEGLLLEIEGASDDYERAMQETSRARNEEVARLNQLNALHAKLDKAIESLRASAPRGTDWRNRANVNKR